VSRTIAVVGAGAAGLTAALRAAEGGADVILLNAHPQVGLKILMSGGTRCNVTHREVTERDFNGGSRVFVRKVLRAFPAERTLEWMESLGVELKLEDTGKYFPVSDEARTVLDALVGEVERAGVRLMAGARVVRIVPPAGAGAGDAGAPRTSAARDAREPGPGEAGVGAGEAAVGAGAPRTPAARDAREPGPGEAAAGAGGGRFRLGIQRVRDSAAFGSGGVSGYGVVEWPLPAVEPDAWEEADAVILATGGLSFPRTGSDGTGYALARSLGHTLEPPTPALTPLTAEDPLCRSLQGVTLEAELALWIEGRRGITVRGSFLFTHFGYSGPAALDLSRHWLRAVARERRVTANFVPGERPDTLLGRWRERAVSEPGVTVRRFLGERLSDRLVTEFCGEAGVLTTTALGQVDRAHRAALIQGVVERVLPVTGTLGYEKAEVTAGGVRLDEVNPATLESRRMPGFYLCGEALDVEGRLGGFNFQWAWSSGTVAGRAAAASG
jgi:hypothetical protein